jgi:hypothetical protein
MNTDNSLLCNFCCQKQIDCIKLESGPSVVNDAENKCFLCI